MLPILQGTFQLRRNSTYRWLFVSKSLEEVRSGFVKSDIRWDTSVTAIVPGQDSPTDRTVFDIYKTGGESLSAYQVAHWQRGVMENWLDAEHQPFRKNMHGERITYGMIVRFPPRERTVNLRLNFPPLVFHLSPKGRAPAKWRIKHLTKSSASPIMLTSRGQVASGFEGKFR